MTGIKDGFKTTFTDMYPENTQRAVNDILRFYHLNPSFSLNRQDDFDEQLEVALLPNGVIRRTVKLQKGWRKDAFGAMLIKRSDTGQLTSLIPGRMNGYTFFDETDCRRKKVTARNENIFENEATAFYLPFPAQRITIPKLLQYIAGLLDRSDVMRLVLSSLAVAFIGLLTPVLNKVLLSDVIASGNVSRLIGTALFFICSILATQLLNIVRALINARLNTKIKVSVEAATMMRVLSLPSCFFKDYASGDLANRCEEMNQICELMINSLMTTGLAGVFSLIYIGQITVIAPDLALPSITVLFVTLMITCISTIMQIKISQKRMQLEARESAMSYSMVLGVRKLKLAGAEQRSLSRWGKLYEEVTRLTYNPPLFLKVSTVITSAVSVLGTISMYTIAAKNGVGVADYYAFSTAFGMVSGAFASLSELSLTATQIKPALEMCRPILNALPENNRDKKTVTSLSGAVSLKNVTFRYSEDGPNILDDLTLEIESGQYVAVVGATGCGKSTLLRIILGFESANEGEVCFDGNPIGSLDTSSLRRRIGTVLQNGRLMQSDIFSNIALTAPYLKREAVWQAAELAGIADDIRAMPMGMSTMVSEGLGGLSGGQKQRLMIARAIAPKPNLLIFDEATSALDNITQKKISDALATLNCTRIVVAHRLSTIRNCDRIIVLDKGKIIEDGTYDSLIAQKGCFAELVERQRLEA